MKKKGQAVFAGIMIFVMLVIVIVQFIPTIKDEIIRARGQSYLDCDNTTIPTGTKMTCIVTDTQLFYFVGMAFAGAAAFLTGKWVKARSET